MEICAGMISAGLNIFKVLAVIIFFYSGPALAQTGGTVKDNPANVYIEIQTAKLRKEPKHWASVAADLKFGQKLNVLARTNGWVSAETEEGKTGFVHASAVTSKQVVLRGDASAVDANADASDIVLAGKGFSGSIEEQFAGTNKDLNYLAVNELEKIVVTEAELARFLSDGKLNLLNSDLEGKG